jgi:LPXTG-motif cell wall-anchored protein
MKKSLWFMSCLLLLPITAIADEATGASETIQSTQSTEEILSTESTVSNTVTATADTVQSSEAVETQPEDVVEAIVAQTGVQASPTAETITEQSDLRSAFTRGITDGSVTAFTQAELDQLTDQQLKDAETLALRYSQDVMGMDIGYFARIVRALFIDQLLSWETIEPQLAFDPSSYSSFAAMIPDLDRLQTYLKVLYPTNGIYISFDQPVSDEWLTSILSHLDQEVAASGSDTLFPGRIGWIMYAVNQGHYLPASSETTESTMESTTASETSAPATEETTTSSKAEVEGATSDSRALPKTGETVSWFLPVIGVVLLVAVGWILWSRKKK